MKNLEPFKLIKLILLLGITQLCYAQTYETIGLIGSSTPLGWDASTPMNLTDPGDPDQWDLTLRLTAGEVKFRANNSWDVNWGGSDYPIGIAVPDGPNIAIPTEGYYTIDFNSQTGEYSFALLSPTVYTTVGIIGSATPLGWDASTPMVQDAVDPHIWTLDDVELIAGELKFRANDSWDVNWGNTDFPSGIAYLNGPNIPVPASSYNITFNDVTGRYNITSTAVYTTVGIIGSATPLGWDASTPMVQDAVDLHLWTLDNVDLVDGELKFRADDSWDVNWGSTDFPAGIAYLNGANIPIPASNYNISFNDLTGVFTFESTVTYETVGIIGSATPLGWDASTPMNLTDPGDPGQWDLTILLSAGEIKFRANDSWDVNWGGSDFPTGTAVRNGPNLVISTAGYYAIDFNSLTGNYNFELLSPEVYTTVGIIGSATVLGWNASTPMDRDDTDEHLWTLGGVVLNDGELKFRTNDSWTVNWGSTEFPSGTGVQDGPNITVPAGAYDISFNDVTGNYNFEESLIYTIVTLIPEYPTPDQEVTVIYDATKGSSELVGASQVYMHSGVVTTPGGTDFEYVVGIWGYDDGAGEMIPVEGETDKWQITLSPSIRDYYGVPASENIFRLGMVFRNEDGTLAGRDYDGGNIYVDIDPGNIILIADPLNHDVFYQTGESITFSANSFHEAASMEMFIDDGSGFVSVATVSNTSQISYDYIPAAPGVVTLRIEGLINSEAVSVEEDYNLVLRMPNVIEEVPAGIEEGITYDPADATRATLMLLAPCKEFVYVVGDFTGWEPNSLYQMKLDPDGERFWLEINGLAPGQEYIYQYWVDGDIKIGDPFADKVLDPEFDADIPEEVYPGLIEYTDTENGIATVLQTNQTPYVFQYPEPVGGRPDVEDLVVYELLVRDFTGTHRYIELADTLNYLKQLGVNAIELMPVMEFEANSSWGYNPIYLFAPDKYYGTKNDLKAFIDKAHEEGFVVILDIVLNHQFNQSPMVMMYWDETNNRPAADNPWFNPVATHPYNVGNDFNHESQYTKDYIDKVNNYWVEEYEFDGFRFDLSKGLTQNEGKDPADVTAWGHYDQSRVDILTRMAEAIWETDPNTYVILEHLSDNDEEMVLADNGMILWGNMNNSYANAVNGNTGINLDYSLAYARGWNNKNLVSYMESHDEERLMVHAYNDGQESAEYNIKDVSIALERIKLASAFFYTTPGPRMLWQFGEVGYDISINYNGRLGEKPNPYDPADGLNYHLDTERQKLYKATAAIINLVNEYDEVFEEGTFSWTPSGKERKINIAHEDMNVTIVGNFGVTPGSIDPDFQHTGIWYDYFSGDAVSVTNTDAEINLYPGEFHIYLDQAVDFPEPDLINVFSPVVSVEPGYFTADHRIKIIFDATQADPGGTDGLVGADKVYMHAGIVLSGPDGTAWENVVGNWGQDDGVGEMTPVQGDPDKWIISFTPREYFGVAADQNVYRLAMVFRDAEGNNVGKSREGGDIYIDVQQGQQVVTVEPEVFTADSTIRIIFDAAEADPAGTAGLTGETSVYMHSGVVLTESEFPIGLPWSNIIGNWGQNDGIGQMTPVADETDKWEITMVPRDYYGLAPEVPVYYLAMVFRNADGSAEGKGPGGTDIYVSVSQGSLETPTNLTVTGTSSFSVSLTWDDNTLSELGYILERSDNPVSDFVVVAFLNNNVTEYTDNSVGDGLTYYYRLKAASAYEPDSDYSNVAEAYTPLAAPSGLTAEQLSLHELELSWEDNSGNETGYILEKAVSFYSYTSEYVEIANLPDNTTSFIDDKVLPGFIYLYRVKAVSFNNESEYSEILETGIEIRPFSITLYPTIVRDGILNLRIEGEVEDFTVTIYNKYGAIQKIVELNGIGTHQIDVNDLSRGFYIVKVAGSYYVLIDKFFIR
ncbi:MAG: SusF/SusE family outer membrane protein [Bacteroidales bacterium]|nr:SusF/SusE family outer membrane protein [Bacteroidales bacterium]